MSCAAVAPSATRFIGVPLDPWSKTDQQAAYKKIVVVCGDPPVCPVSAVLERAALAYVKLRDRVKAAGQ